MSLKLAVLDLSPTQFAVGMREVLLKIAKLKEFSHDDRREFLSTHSFPVVISSDMRHYLIDRHHAARACWEFGIEEVHIEVKADFSHLAPAEFWAAMEKAHWVHLRDQFGAGPHDPNLLPGDVRGLADDPYRSLAWALRHAGAYAKTEEPFAEFKWADFLRQEIKIAPGEKNFAQALKEALTLAQSPKAAHLPGSGKAA